jgi:streptomycin 6-kinase
MVRGMAEKLRIPDVVRAKARNAGADDWIERLPELVAEFQERWRVTVGEPYDGATEAWVAPASGPGADAAVIKLMIPRAGNHAGNEITALRIGGGAGLARLIDSDVDAGATLLERLGAPLSGCGVPLPQRLEIFTEVAPRIWRPAAGSGLPTGAAKGRWLIEFIGRLWDELDRPCTEAAVAYAMACAERRAAAHDDDRAVLVHGDIHQWNTLRAASGWKLVDPDGLLAEPEYDLGVLMREDPAELMTDVDPWDRARFLAARTGTDATAIWEWGAAERVSTGLLLVSVGLRDVGADMLRAAESVTPRGG